VGEGFIDVVITYAQSFAIFWQYVSIQTEIIDIIEMSWREFRSWVVNFSNLIDCIIFPYLKVIYYRIIRLMYR